MTTVLECATSSGNPAVCAKEIDAGIQRSPPDAFNFGLNAGPAAGQTMPQLHFHIIPRHIGDVTDPRGGIRHVIPQKAKYWNS